MEADPRVPYSVLTLVFVIGATTMGWVAAGAFPSRPYLAAIAGGWVIAAGLLLEKR